MGLKSPFVKSQLKPVHGVCREKKHWEKSISPGFAPLLCKSLSKPGWGFFPETSMDVWGGDEDVEVGDGGTGEVCAQPWGCQDYNPQGTILMGT